MKIILSIKPQFAEKIFEGSKQFEFRRTIFKNKDVKKIVVYASAPISKIVGEFEVNEVLNHEINFLWKETKEYSGISRQYYLDYFKGKESGYAIKIDNPKKYKNQKCIRKTYGITPPQSFAYIKNTKHNKSN